MKQIADAVPVIRLSNVKPTTPQSSQPLDLTITQWVEKWSEQPYHLRERIPENVGNRLEAELGAAEQAITPATPKDMAVCLRKLTDFVRVFGLPLDDLTRAAEIYRDALAPLPADLLALAIQRTTENHIFHLLPKPAEIKAQVEQEMMERRARRNRAKLALWTHLKCQTG